MGTKFADAYLELAVNRQQLGPQLNAAKKEIVSRLERIADVASGILTASVARKVYDAFSALPGMLINANDRLEQYRVSLGVMLKDQEKANKLIKDVEEFAARTPFNTSNLMSSVQLLRAYGFELEELLPMMKAIGDAAAASPQGMEFGVHRISLALGQMKSKGKVSAQEMLQLTEAGVAAWDILAKEVGMSMEEVQDATAKGMIRADRAIAAILSGMEKRFGGMMERQSKTWSGLMSTLEDVGEILMRKLGEPLFEIAKVELNNLVEWADSAEARAFVDGMVPAIRDFSILVADVVRGIVRFTTENWELIKTFTHLAITAGKAYLAFLAIQKAIAIVNALRLALMGLSVTPVGVVLTALGLLAAAFVESKMRGEEFTTTLDRMTGGLFGVARAADAANAHMERMASWGDEYEKIVDNLKTMKSDLDKIATGIFEKFFPKADTKGPLDGLPKTDETDAQIKERAAADAKTAMKEMLDKVEGDWKRAVDQADKMMASGDPREEEAAQILIRHARNKFDVGFRRYQKALDNLAVALEERYQKERENAKAIDEFDKRFLPGGDFYRDPGEEGRREDEAAQNLKEGWLGAMDRLKGFIDAGTDAVKDVAKQVADGAEQMQQQAFDQWRREMGIGDEAVQAARDAKDERDRKDFMLKVAEKMGLDPEVLAKAMDKQDSKRVDRFGLVDFVDSLQRSIGTKDDHQKRAARALEQIRDEGVKIKNLPAPQPARVAPG